MIAERPVPGRLEQRSGTRFIAKLPRAIGDAELELAFGKPVFDDPGAIEAGEKTCREWVLVFGDGTVAAIYDYKQPGNYRIGGFSDRAAELAFEALGLSYEDHRSESGKTNEHSVPALESRTEHRIYHALVVDPYKYWIARIIGSDGGGGFRRKFLPPSRITHDRFTHHVIVAEFSYELETDGLYEILEGGDKCIYGFWPSSIDGMIILHPVSAERVKAWVAALDAGKSDRDARVSSEIR